MNKSFQDASGASLGTQTGGCSITKRVSSEPSVCLQQNYTLSQQHAQGFS